MRSWISPCGCRIVTNSTMVLARRSLTASPSHTSTSISCTVESRDLARRWRPGSKDADFGARSLAAFERSALARDGLFDNAYFVSLLKEQLTGRGRYSFQLWTVMNAVLWHESWVAGNADCF